MTILLRLLAPDGLTQQPATPPDEPCPVVLCGGFYHVSPDLQVTSMLDSCCLPAPRSMRTRGWSPLQVVEELQPPRARPCPESRASSSSATTAQRQQPPLVCMANVEAASGSVQCASISFSCEGQASSLSSGARAEGNGLTCTPQRRAAATRSTAPCGHAASPCPALARFRPLASIMLSE